MSQEFIYEKTLKTDPKDDFHNLQKYLYIGSEKITSFLFSTGISPHNVIFFSVLIGSASAILIISDNILLRITGSLMLFLKNILDKVDGSLARARGQDSRRGRFYDSIADFIVTAAVFSAIAYYLYHKYHSLSVIVLTYLAMVFSMLQCSYFIFYQVSFIRITGKKTVNRVIESITAEDLATQDKLTLCLQRIFQIIYGWQDRLFFLIDKMILKILPQPLTDDKLKIWYKDKLFLRLASSLSIGTHILLTCICAIFGIFEVYLFLNLIIMNLLLIFTIIYHYKRTLKLIYDISYQKI